MKIVIITGMPGAGKTEVSESFRKAGFSIVVMGDVIREEIQRRGLEPNSKNARDVMLELRELDGLGVVAKRCVERLKEERPPLVVIEGCRSIAEVEVFSRVSEEMKIIGVHSSPRTRFSRLTNRRRGDDPLDWSAFRERDLREISVGLGGVIALSDIMLVNEGSVDELRLKTQEILKEARF